MQNDSHRPEHARNEMWLKIRVRYVWRHRGIRISIGIALVLLAWDAGLDGSLGLSLLGSPI